MRTLALKTFLPVLLLGLTGCGISGTWKTVEVDPGIDGMAPRFSELVLDSNGSYTAKVDYGHGLRDLAGTYTFGDGRLTFSDDGGKTADYNAELTGFMNSELRVMNDGDGDTWTVVMERD